MTENFFAICIDVICFNCGKFMGHHLVKYEIMDREKAVKKARRVMRYLNNNDVSPMCATCTTTTGTTIESAKGFRK